MTKKQPAPESAPWDTPLYRWALGGRIPLAYQDDAEARRAAGYDVVNPAEINPDHSATWANCLRADIAALVTCDAVATLPGHENSRGARLEIHIAKELGMPVLTVEQFVALAEVEPA